MLMIRVGLGLKSLHDQGRIRVEVGVTTTPLVGPSLPTAQIACFYLRIARTLLPYVPLGKRRPNLPLPVSW